MEQPEFRQAPIALDGFRRYVEHFRGFLDAIGSTGNLMHFQGESYRRLFEAELPQSMGALLADTSATLSA